MSAWPAEVYDYERARITDDGVADLDLQCGTWIRCKCGSTLKTRWPFRLHPWVSHKKTIRHKEAKRSKWKKIVKTVRRRSARLVTQQRSQPLNATKAIPSNRMSFASVANEIDGESTPWYHAQTMLKPAKIYSQHDADIGRVINAMTLLITEREEDIDTMRQMMTEVIQEMKKMRQELDMLYDQQQLKNGIPAKSTVHIIRNDVRDSCEDGNIIRWENDADDKSTDIRYTDMSIFDDQSQLMG